MDFHIESAGEGPAIVFLHAGVADSRMWRDQMSLDGYRSIAFDRRGFGKTPLGDEQFSDWEDAIAVLDHLGVDSATIVGCSMGGATALEVAIERPDRVDALVLVGAAPAGWEPEGDWEDHPLWEEAVAAYKAGDLDRVAEIDMEMWLVGYGRDSSGIDPSLKELFLDMDRTPLRTEDKRNELSKRYEKGHLDHLDAISAPTLVIIGEHDESYLLAAADFLAQKLSDRPPVVLAGTAHLPSFEKPEEFNSALAGFLGSL
ncbi:MAG: alpha/beta fold hydrolase [Acidimicrobiia bacterium]|nr:alpha/beta fold hydrolase [Acidimicrobiia bacterium]